MKKPIRKLIKQMFALVPALAVLGMGPANAYPVGLKKMGHNYFGSREDGAVTISVDTNVTSTTDGDFAYKNYTGLTINASRTLTVSNRCKGLFVYVDGDCTINGTLTMTARGPTLTSPAEGIFFRRAVDSSGARGLETAYISAATGGAGATSGGSNGGTATNGTGGGGAGGSAGEGGSGTCFSGGAGGGSGGSAAVGAGAGTAGGGVGTNGGGAGNPGGAGDSADDGDTGTGGFLCLMVSGNLTIGSGGKISANGSDGGDASSGGQNRGGGASGAGRVFVFYGGTLSNSGSCTANGGVGGDASGGTTNIDGGNGGAGTVTGPTKISKG